MATEERMLLLQRSGRLAAAAGGDRLDLAQSDEPVCAEFLALKRANLALLPSPEEEKGRVHGTLGSLFGQRGRRRLQASQGSIWSGRATRIHLNSFDYTVVFCAFGGYLFYSVISEVT